MNILVVNDDSINSQGLQVLVNALSYQGKIYVAAPKYEQSACSHKITIIDEIYIEEQFGFFGSAGTIIVDGSPADCVRVAIKKFSEVDFDLVVSGINNGLNLSIDTHYSGTIAAAMEARILGIPALAISAADISKDFLFDETIKIIDEIINTGVYDFDGILNINIPNTKPKGVVVVPLGFRTFHAEYTLAPSSKTKYFIQHSIIDKKTTYETDSSAIDEGYASVTPLLIDLTNYRQFNKLKRVFSGEINHDS